MICYSYFNDTLGAVGLAAYTDLIISFYAKRIIPPLSLINISEIMMICGVLWEYVVPFFRKDTVSDPLDIIAYIAGGAIYRLFFIIIIRLINKKRSS